MNNDILSQKEIDALLSSNDEALKVSDDLDDEDKDLLGEIGNICMGSAATALSKLINQKVSITTPKVKVTTLDELKKTFEVPNISIEVRFIKGLGGANLLVLKVPDAGIIADLMMGQKGDRKVMELSEIEMSAVSEAMNQMIGSAATSMASMFKREVNISPPNAFLWDNKAQRLSNVIEEGEKVVHVAFKLKVGSLVDSEIMQLFPIETAQSIIDAMNQNYRGSQNENEAAAEDPAPADDGIKEKTDEKEDPQKDEVLVDKAQFMPLHDCSPKGNERNIDLILDVPIEISAILGRTTKTIKEILDLNNGSLIELDKLVEEPVDILVNGKMVAQGEVVVVNENFGVRITNIVSNAERVKGLKDK